MLALSLTVSIAAAVCRLRRPAGAVPMGRQSKNTYRLFLLLILIAGIALRVWDFGSIPGGVNQDGAMAAVDAKALARAEEAWFEAIDYLHGYELIDSEHFINHALAENKSILCEGAQGTMLDVDFGSYPFVTSSNTICAGACTGLGVAPNKIGDVFGIFKAYCTCVGSGPFPTELFDETGKKIRDLGHEYGAVTGRERRCGWIDLVALRYAIMINGVTQLIMMKSDVLDGFDTIKACTAYDIDGFVTRDFPYSIDGDIKPVYTELPGWKTDMTKMKSESEFPQAFRDYIAFLEDQLATPITIVSIGPDREQTIVRER